MNVLLEDIKRKKAESERLAQRGKVKYDYDPDEETDGGTWEHKRYVPSRRRAPMLASPSARREGEMSQTVRARRRSIILHTSPL